MASAQLAAELESKMIAGEPPSARLVADNPPTLGLARIRETQKNRGFDFTEIVRVLLQALDNAERRAAERQTEITALQQRYDVLAENLMTVSASARGLMDALVDCNETNRGGPLKRFWERVTQRRTPRRFLINIVYRSGTERYGHILLPGKSLPKLFAELMSLHEIKEARVYQEMFRNQKPEAFTVSSDKLLDDLATRIREEMETPRRMKKPADPRNATREAVRKFFSNARWRRKEKPRAEPSPDS